MPGNQHSDRLDRIEAAVEQLVATDQRIRERHEALAQTVELLTRDIEQDGEHIRALARNSQNLHDSIKSLENIATARH